MFVLHYFVNVTWSTYLHNRLARRVSITRVLSSLRIAILLWLRCRGLERLLEVGDDVVDVLCAHRDADEVLVQLLVLLHSLVLHVALYSRW